MSPAPEPPEDHFDYPRLIARALRRVAWEVLDRVAREGFPGEHHVYLAFDPAAEGVVVPRFLAERYPDEVTIILQHQFWDLDVDEDGFAVTLLFDGARQRLVVPLDALTAFSDPSVGLGLRFEPAPAEEGGEEAGPPEGRDGGGEPPGDGDGAAGNVVSIDRFRRD